MDGQEENPIGSLVLVYTPILRRQKSKKLDIHWASSLSSQVLTIILTNWAGDLALSNAGRVNVDH
jgi:hypothetical protein